MRLKDILYQKKDSPDTAIEYNSCYITYAELFNKVEEIAKLIKSTKQNYNTIGVYLNNSINYIVAYFAIAFADKIIVPMSVKSHESELLSMIDYCDLDLVITDSLYREDLLCILQRCTYKITVFNLDDKSLEEQFRPCRDFLSKESFQRDRRSDKAEENNDVALILHTSGTTSRPRRVMLTDNNLISNIRSISKVLDINKKSRTLLALPMHLSSGNSQMLTHLYVGAAVIIMDMPFFPGNVLSLIQNRKVTNFFGVPFHMEALIRLKNVEKYDLGTLRFMCFGGGPVYEEGIIAFHKMFSRIGFIQMYGQTEASPRITHLLADDCLKKLGSVGLPIPGVKLRIIDCDGRDVDPDEVGELIVSGENIMKGYYKCPEETSEVLRDGWLYTGDLASRDRDGYVYIAGRSKNIIIYSGYNIYPEEVEEVLLSHPDVSEAYVYGMADEFSGQVPVAKVVLEYSRNASPDELIKFCFEKLESYKIPNRIIITEHIDRTLSGKIKRALPAH